MPAKKAAPKKSTGRVSRAKRQPAVESTEACLAFEQFCALGQGRTYAKVARLRLENKHGAGLGQFSEDELRRVTNVEERQIETWGAAWQWQERVKDYDRRVYAEARAEERKELVRSMKGLRKDLIIGLQVDVGRYLNQLARDANNPNAKPVLITKSDDLRRGLDMLTELSGVPLGNIDDLDDDEPGAAAEELRAAANSPEELARRLERLLRRATG